MKNWMRLSLMGVATAALATAALGWLLQAAQATLPAQSAVHHNDVERALNLARLHDPRNALAGRISAVSATERDLDLLLNHAAHRLLGARLSVNLEPGVALLGVSTKLPQWPRGPWINVQARWRETEGLPELAALRLGRLPVPVWLARPALRMLAARAVGAADLELVAQVVQRAQFGRDRLHLVYVWHEGASSRVMAVLTPPAEQERLRAYAERLVELTSALPIDTPLPLASLLQGSFALAEQRAGAGTGEATAEARAAILSLALYVTGRGPGSLVAAAKLWPQPRRLRVTLLGREDLAQHFLVSAALAIEGSGPLAAAIGLYKEVDDSHRGSGFSFNDMAANRAGTRLGESALNAPQPLLSRLAAGVEEASLMPDVADLPEYLGAAEFKRRFGAVGSPAYQRLIDDIERRVGALGLYR